MIDLAVPQYAFDFSNKVLGHNVIQDVVEAKFRAWDQVLAYDLLKEPVRAQNESNELYEVRKYQYKQAYGLLEDDTVYAYANFELNGKPLKLFPVQDAIINDQHYRIDVEAANQIGKSLTLCVKGSVSFLRDHGKNWTIGLISKSMPQNMNNMRLIKQLLGNSNVKYEPGMQDNMTVITRNVYETTPDGKKTAKILYTNTLVCAVASTSALGFPFNLLLLDEFEFWDESEGETLEFMYDQVMKPRLFATKGQLIIFSNPNGKNFVSEDLHKRLELDGVTKEFHIYNFNFLDRPGNTPQEWEKEQKNTHPIIFASTMAAQRTEGKGAALTDFDIRNSVDPYLVNAGQHAGFGKECFFFLDIGFVHDQSVLKGGYWSKFGEGPDDIQYNEFLEHYYPIGHPIEQVFGYGERDADQPSVKEYLDRYQKDGVQPVFGYDITGKEGNEVHARLAGITAHDIKMSGPWKSTWYGRFITLVKQGRYKRGHVDNWLGRRNRDWESQARTLQIKVKTPDGRNLPYPLYHHTNENDLDDSIDASVGMLSLIDAQLGHQGSVSRIDFKTPYDNEMDARKLETERRKQQAKEPYDEDIERELFKQRASGLYDSGFGASVGHSNSGGF